MLKYEGGSRAKTPQVSTSGGVGSGLWLDLTFELKGYDLIVRL